MGVGWKAQIWVFQVKNLKSSLTNGLDIKEKKQRSFTFNSWPLRQEAGTGV